MLNIQEEVSLKDFTTFKIGGRTKYFIKASNDNEIKGAVKWTKEKKLPFFILGGGSNILFSDSDYNGVIIKIENRELNFKGNEVIAGAGIVFLKLILFCKEKSLSGLEWGAGIPGTVGGAIFGNAGAFGGEVKNNIKEVLAVDKETLEEKRFSSKDCKFSYRNSIFKKTKKYIISSGIFSLEKKEKGEIGRVIREHILYRKEHHPLGQPSAGSIFKNIKTKDIENSLLERFFEFKEKAEVPAAYIIDKAGLKGKRVGGAKISEKHTNFIVNYDNAKAKDIISLINFIKGEVKKKFDIELKEEVIIIK
ncbi:MAG: UDP-N-acetylmuramate dehydrogenase [Candidatus Pacebacteria bacterium]|nr:UDP-N-acetylmuramate dehydrogenase [Candidatus Paceibacterota bacterium]